MFVSCDRNGASKKKLNIGKVVRCVDTDGDGVADTFTNFIDKMNCPRGSCYVDDTLYLMHPPYLHLVWDFYDRQTLDLAFLPRETLGREALRERLGDASGCRSWSP